MGRTTRFDLTSAVGTWRNALRRNASISDDEVEELESHLMDAVNTLSQTGLSTEESFLVARHRIGEVRTLHSEYRKNTWWPDVAAAIQRFVMVTGVMYLAIRGAAVLYVAASGGFTAAATHQFYLIVQWSILGSALILIAGLIIPKMIRGVNPRSLGTDDLGALKQAKLGTSVSLSAVTRSLLLWLCRWVLPTLLVAFILPALALRGFSEAYLEGGTFFLGPVRALFVAAVLFLLITDLPHALYKRAFRRAALYLLFVPWLAAFAIATADSDVLMPATILLGVAYPCLITLVLYRWYSLSELPARHWAIA